MTLPAIETPAVRGLLTGPKYKVGPECSNPGCGKGAEHVHHIIRRTKIGGPFDWVEVDGHVYPNLCGLCPGCHDDVTGREGVGHKAAIFLQEGTWWWCLLARSDADDVTKLTPRDYRPVAPLYPHPPTPESLDSGAPEPSESAAPCPFCGQRKRRRPQIRGAGRRRKSWTILVPDDTEDGAAVLDALIEDLALILDIEPNQTGRYFVVLPALYHAVQDRAAFVKSLEGVGG